MRNLATIAIIINAAHVSGLRRSNECYNPATPTYQTISSMNLLAYPSPDDVQYYVTLMDEIAAQDCRELRTAAGCLGWESDKNLVEAIETIRSIASPENITCFYSENYEHDISKELTLKLVERANSSGKNLFETLEGCNHLKTSRTR